MTSTTTAPRFEDFTCPRCKAGVGKPCTMRRPQRPGCLPVHAPRHDKWRRAHARWLAESGESGG
ncbi:hypothetical protein AB0F81_23345 [Actinoplanes sp. NPDC024001]|uniref:zinc finger domain-containing protein n=1 Tax=Actinoplanes sp. NPDC024001 TaxID=3154598 RepID=UPI00340DC1AA